MSRPRRWRVWFGSARLRGRDERRLARLALRRGDEPEPRYSTGRFWED